MYAAMHGQEDLVNLMAVKLIRRWGFDILRVKNLMGFTAENLAIKNNHNTCAKLLEKNRLQMLNRLNKQLAMMQVAGKTKGWIPFSMAYNSIEKQVPT